MLKKEEIEKIERYTKGESNDSEKVWLESLFIDNGENNHDLKKYLADDWNKILLECHNREFENAVIPDRIRQLIGSERNALTPLRKVVRIYMRVAAILLLPLIVSGVLYYSLSNTALKNSDQNTEITINAPVGSRISFVLPDSTFGMLNSGSRLTYHMPFTSRRIELDGEAWFDVKKDEKHPFLIGAADATIKVLGTSFNLISCNEEKYVELVLQTGQVDFQTIEGQNVHINPSEKLSFKEGLVDKHAVDPGKYSAWTEGKLVFRSDPMPEVVSRLERWYNVKIILADSELEKYSFRATFQDDTLEEVLKCLAMSSPIEYKIIPRKLLPNGVYSKEEVTIYKVHY